MRFTKMEGLGNDYIYLNCLEGEPEDLPALAVRLSDRHFGVGADGLICVKPGRTGDFTMEMYNADGSRGAMCGNGIRCVGKYVRDYGLTDKDEISVETLAGIKYLRLTAEDGKVAKVRVNMGEPILSPERIPVKSDHEPVVQEPIEVCNREWRMTCVSMGNPHCVVFVPHVENIDIEKIGPKFEESPLFPEGVNVEFVKVIDKHTLKMRVWERGSGETWACGTGACAVAVAAVVNGYCDKEKESYR